MRDLNDLKTAMTIVNLDIADTVSKLSTNAFIFAELQDVIDDLCDDRAYEGSSEGEAYRLGLDERLASLIPSGENDVEYITTVGGKWVSTKIFTENISPHYVTRHFLFTCEDDEQDLVFEIPIDALPVATLNGVTIIDVNNKDDYSLSDNIVVNNYSIGAIINTIRDSIQVESFMADLTDVVKGSKMYNFVYTKWMELSKTSLNVRGVIDEFFSSVKNNSSSIATWIATKFSKASEATIDEDGVSWTNYDYTVASVLNTVIKGALSSIVSLAGLVLTAVSKVAGVVVMAVGCLVKTISNLLNNATNPVIQWKGDDYDEDFIPIPIMRYEASGNTIENSLFPNNTSSCSIISFLLATRVFKDQVNGNVKYESFLRTAMDPYALVDLIKTLDDVQDIRPTQDGIYGIDRLYNSVFAVSDSFDTKIMNQISTEQGQCLYIYLYLWFVYMFFCSGTVTSHTINVSDAWNRVNGESATANDIFDILYYYVSGVNNNSWTDSDTEAAFFGNGPSIIVSHLNWLDLVQHFIPQMMVWTQSFPLAGYSQVIDDINDGDILAANEHILLHTYATRQMNTVCPECFNGNSSGFIVPRHTGKGAITALVATAVLTTAVVVSSVIVARKIRKGISRIQQDKANKCADLRAFYNEVAASPSASENDKKVAWNAYYKSVRSYNRMSFLWGGSTFSMVNGWDDGPSDVSLGAVSSLSTKVSDLGILNQNENGSMAVHDIPTQNYELSNIVKLIKG